MTQDCNDTKKRQGGRKRTGAIITLPDGRLQGIVTFKKSLIACAFCGRNRLTPPERSDTKRVWCVNERP